MASHLTLRKFLIVNAALLALLIAAIVVASLIGSGDMDIAGAFTSGTRSHAILFQARLPRIILAAFVGMALASSGGVFQATLKNPLADPFILGISGGAALGSVIGIGLSLPFFASSSLAFVGAMASMIVIFFVTARRGNFRSSDLLLTGVIFNAFCFALILFINAIVSMEEAYQILFLLIGNLEETGPAMVAVVGVFVLIGFLALSIISRRINALMLGDTEAKSLGIDVMRLRAAAFIFSSLMVGAAVAASGLIGFVGLFIPHAIRLAFGSDNRLLIPASGLAGAAFLVIADSAARTLLMNTQFATELPVGVITALIGAPLFMFLLSRQRGEASP
jgi:iron complex transport system permease protein